MAKKWSDEEIEIVKENYSKMDTQEMIDVFNLKRTKTQIQDYANKKLKLHKDKKALREKQLKTESDINEIENYNTEKIKRDIWTIVEDDIIKELYPTQDKDFILNILKGRTWDAIRNRAIKLKVSRIRKWSDEEIEILKKYYPNRTLNELKEEFFNNKSLDMIESKARVLRLYKSSEYLNKYRSGENNNNWCGGITELSNYIRDCMREWVIASFNFYNGKCVITNSSKNLELHHLYPFNKILKETLNDLNLSIHKTIGEYTEKELNNIVELCLKKHYEYGYGIPLDKTLHKEFHKYYGKIDFNKDDFLNFCKENNYNVLLK